MPAARASWLDFAAALKLGRIKADRQLIGPISPQGMWSTAVMRCFTEPRELRPVDSLQADSKKYA